VRVVGKSIVTNPLHHPLINTHTPTLKQRHPGLISRYALGVLYNPASGTVAGLRPVHFVSMATPHCGCDTDGVSAVPFIRWTEDLPLLGAPLYGLLSTISHAASTWLLARTGEQFFMVDGSAHEGADDDKGSAAAAAAPAVFGVGDMDQPLLFQMTQDVPEKGMYFYSALAAFKTRTAYANTDGDHLVGWANSSLRPLHGLPPLPPDATRSARGVVLEDPLSSAFQPQDWEQVRRAAMQQQLKGNTKGARSSAATAEYAPSRTYNDGPSASQQQQGSIGSTEDTGKAGKGAEGAEGTWRALGSGSSAGAAGAVQSSGGGADDADEWGQSIEDEWAVVTAGVVAAAAGVDERKGAAALRTAAAASALSGITNAAADREGSAKAVAAEEDLRKGLAVSGSGNGAPPAAVKGATGGKLKRSNTIVPPPETRAERVSVMLQRLSALPWRRMDVSFEGTTWGLAHNNIQVTRRFLNFQGKAVPRHLAEQLAQMELMLADLNDGAAAAAAAAGNGGGDSKGDGE